MNTFLKIKIENVGERRKKQGEIEGRNLNKGRKLKDEMKRSNYKSENDKAKLERRNSKQDKIYGRNE